LKEALQGLRVERIIERVAKPEGDTPRSQGKGFFGANRKVCRQAGLLDLDMLKGEEAKARQFFKSGMRRRRP
jgi:hypothetical protein